MGLSCHYSTRWVGGWGLLSSGVLSRRFLSSSVYIGGCGLLSSRVLSRGLLSSSVGGWGVCRVGILLDMEQNLLEDLRDFVEGSQPAVARFA